MIKEQYEQGRRVGRADARIVSRESKVCRWINVNNINHKHDDWIYGYCKGFVEQTNEMFIEDNLAIDFQTYYLVKELRTKFPETRMSLRFIQYD